MIAIVILIMIMGMIMSVTVIKIMIVNMMIMVVIVIVILLDIVITSFLFMVRFSPTNVSGTISMKIIAKSQSWSQVWPKSEWIINITFSMVYYVW